MPESTDIDAAISATLMGDAALMALCPDGVYFDQAAPTAQRFVLVSLIAEEDIPIFGGNGIEDALYLIKAVMLASVATNGAPAAARIQALFEDRPLSLSQGSPAGVPGYTWMTCHREARIRIIETDDKDPNIRWQHMGGHYRVTMSVGS